MKWILIFTDRKLIWPTEIGTREEKSRENEQTNFLGGGFFIIFFLLNWAVIYVSVTGVSAEWR